MRTLCDWTYKATESMHTVNSQMTFSVPFEVESHVKVWSNTQVLLMLLLFYELMKLISHIKICIQPYQSSNPFWSENTSLWSIRHCFNKKNSKHCFYKCLVTPTASLQYDKYKYSDPEQNKKGNQQSKMCYKHPLIFSIRMSNINNNINSQAGAAVIVSKKRCIHKVSKIQKKKF